MITAQNFNWEVTRRPLVVFIPNHGRGNYIRKTLAQFNTSLSSIQYSVIIGNDGLHESFEDLQEQNIHYFTLEREKNAPARNGCFIRNYFIKRCLSTVLFQKDPETVLISYRDWMLNCLSLLNEHPEAMYRPRITATFTQDQTGNMLGIKEDASIILTKLIQSRKASTFLESIDKQLADENGYARVHFGYGVRTKLLQDIHGYDEKFVVYGPEDRDMYERLLALGINPFFDNNTIVGHLWHDVNPIVYQQVNDMHKVYMEKKRNFSIIANPDGWGEG